jgi:signal transduction histidine kinase
MVWLLIMLLAAGPGIGQTKRIDSIKALLNKQSVQQRQQLSTVFAMCSQYNSLHPDTLLSYVQLAKQLSANTNRFEHQAMIGYYEALYNSRKGRVERALVIADSFLADKRTFADPAIANRFRLTKTGIMVRQNKLKEALASALDLLHEAEKINSAEDQLKAQIQIGWTYMELNQHADALKWFFIALNTNKNGRRLPEPSVLNSNIAAVYNSLNKNDSATIFIQKALQQAIPEQDLSFLCNSYYIYADICIDQGNVALAETLLKKGVEIRKKIGEPFYLVADLAQLGKFYASVKQFDKGIATIQEGIAIAAANKLNSKLLFLHTMLAENYKAANDLVHYSQTLSTIIDLKDTLYNQNSAEAMTALQTEYEFQKKENIIIQQRLDLVQKTYWMYAAGALLLFGALLWYLNHKSNRRKQQQKLALARAEEKRMMEKAIADAQEKERKRIAADLHDNLGAYAAAISSNVDSITTALKSQDGTGAYAELKANSQAIVSQLNDTIWVLTKEVLALTAISDRLKVFIQRLNSSYPTVKIDVNEQIETDQLLAPMQAFHLFKILQEAIVNALKHSNCSELTITLESRLRWQIQIADNGKGMLLHNGMEQAGGNGMRNMKNRAEEAGWTIEWTELEPTGTAVTITAG